MYSGSTFEMTVGLETPLPISYTFPGWTVGFGLPSASMQGFCCVLAGAPSRLPSKRELRILFISLALFSSRLMKKILGEDSSPPPTTFLRAFSRSLHAQIADLLASEHTSPSAYTEGTIARFLIRTRL